MEAIRFIIVLHLIVCCARIYYISGFQFTPRKVFFEETSQLTLYGSDLNKTDNPVRNVTVCGQPCHNITNKMGNITCAVSKRQFRELYNESCDITVIWSFNKSDHNISELRGKETLKFVWPELKTFKPTHGRVSVGTTVTLSGNHLNINRSILITVANVPCNSTNKPNRGNGTSLKCKIGKPLNDTPYCGSVEISIDNFTQKVKNKTFCYTRDPVITSVSPNETIQSGGITLTLSGENLDYDVEFELLLEYNNKKSGAIKCTKNEPQVMTCQTPNVHKMTESYFRNKAAIYVNANLVMKMDNNVIKFNSSNVIRIYRDPNFKNLSPLECFSTSKNQTLYIKGDYFSEFISSRVNVTTALGERCQMKYVNESFMECHIHVSKNNNQNPESKRNNSTETTTPEFVSGSSYKHGILSGQTSRTSKSLHHKGKTTSPSLASTTKTPKPFCPLNIQIGNIKVQLIEVKGTDHNHSWHMFYLIPSAVIVVLVALLLALTVKLKNLKSMKEKLMYLHFTEANSGCGRNASQTLKQILDSVAPEDDGKDTSTLIVALDFLTVGKCIGSGNFGCVYEGVLTLEAGFPPLRVAIKTLQDPFSNSIDLLGFVQEALIMKDFHHPNVMGLVGLAEKEPGVPYVILPFMDKGDLLTYVRDPAVSLALHDVIKFCADIADGMAYLSSLKCVHRDLAARNCMLDTGNRVKVADFGLCRDIYEKGYYTSDNKKKLPIRWMALESIENGAYSTKSDVWSLGVVLWELLTRGLTPYPGVDGWDVVNFLRRRRLPPPYFCPESLYNLMMVCWANDPIKRPTFENIKSELLLLIGQSSSGVSCPSQSHDKTLAQKDDLVSVKGNVSKNVKRGTGLNKRIEIQDTSAGVLNKKSTLGKTTLSSRKVSREQVTKLRPSCDDESEASRDVLPTSTGDAIDPRKTDGSETCCGLSISSYMPRPRVVRNFLITLPECFSDREVSRLAISLYENLVDNYEPPRKFTNPFLSLSRKFSKRSTEKWRQDIKIKYRINSREDVSDDEESGDGSEDPRIGDDGAYHILPPERWSTILDDRNCSFRSYANDSSGDSLYTALNTTTLGPPFCNENDVSGDSSTVSPPRPHLPLSRQASQQ